MDADDDARLTERITFTARIDTYRFLEVSFPEATTASEAVRMAVNELRMHRASVLGDESAFEEREELIGRFTTSRRPDDGEDSEDA